MGFAEACTESAVGLIQAIQASIDYDGRKLTGVLRRHVLGSKKVDAFNLQNKRSGGARWNGVPPIEVYEGVPGVSGAARARTGIDDARGSETTRHLRQDVCELGVSRTARPAREFGG